MKKLKLLLSVITLCLTLTMSSLAGTWKSDTTGWWYENNDGSYYANGWQWIDGNIDGIAECYYFDSNGYCLINTTTPDGYLVDSNGAWIIDGVVQTKSVTVTASSTEQPPVTANVTVSDNQHSEAETTVTETSNVHDGISSTPYAGYTILVNTNTGKYHVPTCKSVKQMKDKNKGYCSDVNYLLSNGYVPCKNCH